MGVIDLQHGSTQAEMKMRLYTPVNKPFIRLRFLWMLTCAVQEREALPVYDTCMATI